MPGKGYSTIGLKPSISSRLHNLTDAFYPGMFLPSTLIILMNEVKLGFYKIESHKINLDLSGRYNTITIRSDVKEWLNQQYEEKSDEYKKNYGVKCFANFLSYFLTNLFESKFNSQNHVIKLKESDFEWLQNEYKKKQKNASNLEKISFDRFADSYLNEIISRMKKAKEILEI